jgi:hypothetical protein
MTKELHASSAMMLTGTPPPPYRVIDSSDSVSFQGFTQLSSLVEAFVRECSEIADGNLPVGTQRSMKSACIAAPQP